eukprot:1683287-Ditylum_brightwellii.AAC.1
MGMISLSLSSWRRLAMIACNLVIISRSSAGISDIVGSSVDAVEDRGNSELILHAIIAPVVGEFDCCDATGVVCSDLLAIDLAKIFEESGVDIFADFVIGVLNSFVVEGDDMMVPERNFQWHGNRGISTSVEALRQKARGELVRR